MHAFLAIIDSRVNYFDQNNQISMHEFPKDEKIKEAWIQAIDRQGIFIFHLQGSYGP